VWFAGIDPRTFFCVARGHGKYIQKNVDAIILFKQVNILYNIQKYYITTIK
jgi:hypothetical protein